MSGFLCKVGRRIRRAFVKDGIKMSVVVPVCRCPECLEQTLDSVCAQTAKPYEVIVVADAGFVVPGALQTKYPGIRFCTCGVGAGLDAMVREGLAVSKGDYLCFCECGDLWEPGHLAQLREGICKRNAALLFAGAAPVEEVKTWAFSWYMARVKSYQGGKGKFRPLRTPFNPEPTMSTCCVLRSLLAGCDICPPSPEETGWWIWRQLLLQEPYIHLSGVSVKWRVPEESFADAAGAIAKEKRRKEFIVKSNLFLLKRFFAGPLARLALPHALGKKDYCEVRRSRYFDAEYYRKNSIPEDERWIEPAVHYLMVGWYRGLDPSARFSTSKYLSRRPDVNASGICPLLHQGRVTSGEAEVACFPVSSKPEFHEPEGFDREAFDADRHKALLMTHELSFTGAPMLLISVAEMLREGGYQVAIISPKPGKLQQRILAAGFPVIVDERAFFEDDGYLPYKEQGYTFCLVNTVVINKAFSIFKDHIPSIWWIHDNLTAELVVPEIQQALVSSDNVYVPSQLTRSCYSDYGHDIKLMTYPVKDVVKDSFRPKSPEGVIRCVVVGTYCKRKGQDIALEALHLMPKDKVSRLHVVLVGEAPSGDPIGAQLQDSARDLGDSVEFRGVIKNADAYHALYEEADVLLCPSRSDPYPLVVLDGLMHGCPVVISDKVGQSCLLTQGGNGYVFTSGDAAALADVLTRIVDRQADLPKMSQAARDTYLENADYTVCSGKLMKIVQELTAAK